MEGEVVKELKRKIVENAVERFSAEKKSKHGDTAGVMANECIQIFFVNSIDEMNAATCVPTDPVFIQFDDDNGKIYGYKDLKINIYFNVNSFHSYVDISFQSKKDDGKGITDVKYWVQNLLGTESIDKKVFIDTFISEDHCIRDALSSGLIIRHYSFQDINSESIANIDINSTIEVVQMNSSCDSSRLLYNRFSSLIPLLIEGGEPVDIDDPCWGIYFAVKKIPTESGEAVYKLLGFASAYQFYHYPDSSRLRISQILVFPPYQRQGNGHRLLESMNSLAISKNYHDVTFEDPSDYLQYLRTYIDVLRLDFECINSEIISNLKKANRSKSIEKILFRPQPCVVEAVREKLKLHKKHFLRCWEILIFCNIDRKNKTCMDKFIACLMERLKADILGKDTSTNGKRVVKVENDTTFVMYKCGLAGEKAEVIDEEKHIALQESLDQVVEQRMKQIDEIAKKVFSMGFKSLNFDLKY